MWSDQQTVTSINQAQTSQPHFTGWFGLRCALVLVSLTLITGCQGHRSTEPPSGVVELTDANFHHEVMESKQPVLVEFWAPWCRSCVEMQPTLEGLTREFSGSVVAARLNIDEWPDIATEYGVDSPPVIILFRSGEVAKRRSGGQSLSELRELLTVTEANSKVDF
ncbi:MAG: thioredoxin [Planctomycetaceae bacterium]|nr:thioredoxin [Planctomycetaceae bacterium]